jgi:hypothetical protein
MSDLREAIHRRQAELHPRSGGFQRLVRRRRARRGRRIAAGVVAVVVLAAAGALVGSYVQRGREVPAHPPRIHSKLIRLAPYDGVALGTFAVPAVAPTAITAAGGSLWIASADDALLRIDPANGHVQARLTLDGYPQALTVLGDSVWVLEPGALQAVDTQNSRLARRVDVPQRPSAIAAGDGALWLAGPEGVQRFDPASSARVQVEPARDQMPAPAGLVFGAGSAWVLHPCEIAGGPSTLKRYDGRTGHPTARITVPGCPSMIATAYDAIQVGSSDGTVDLIEPATNAITSRRSVGAFLDGTMDVLMSGNVNGREYGLVPTALVVDMRDGTVSTIELYPRNGLSYAGTTHRRTPVSGAAIAFGAVWLIEP